jgi:hypothetical protein
MIPTTNTVALFAPISAYRILHEVFWLQMENIYALYQEKKLTATDITYFEEYLKIRNM